MALEELNTFLGLPAFMWFFIFVGTIAGCGLLWMVHEVFIMNSFAKQARGMKRGKGVYALIQENNVLRLLHSRGGLPEGLYAIENRWYLRPQNPYLGGISGSGSGVGKRGPGRPPKNPPATENPESPNTTISESSKQVDVLKPVDREALQEVLQVPILDGVGKPLFVGCVNQPLLLSPSTVAHADLPRIREIIPETLTQTQLDALFTYSKLKGIKMAGKEQMKIIILALAAAMVIGTMGLIVYLLTQPRTPAAALTFLLGLIH